VRTRSVVIASLAAGTAAVAGLSIYGAYQVISPRRSLHRDDPTIWGLPCEEVHFDATDGVRLAAWLARSMEDSGAAVIVVHGHGGNRHTSLAYASYLFPDFSLLLPDLRGHGDSLGTHTSVGYLERRDLIGAALYLRGLGYQKIGVLGISMGAAVAILAAAQSEAIDAVVADSSFAALRHAVRQGARIRGYPSAITRPLAYLCCQTAAWRLRHPLRACDPLDVVGAIAPRPLFLIHGEADDLIPADSARALYAAAGEPKDLWVLPEVEHGRALEADGDRYRERVLRFFLTWLSPEPPTALQVGQPAADAGSG
jgi:fermentation-respiration switch protein FrsA (DUF1100 family)